MTFFMSFAEWHETHICRSAHLSSKSRSTGTPWSRCRQANALSGICTQSLHRRRSFSQRSSCCGECRASRMTAADVDTRSEDNRDCSRHRSTANCAHRPERRSSARRCSCSAGPCPTSASPPRHLLAVESWGMLMWFAFHSLEAAPRSSCSM